MLDQFFAKEFAGPPFQLFGPHHLTAVAIILLLNGGLLAFGRQIPLAWRAPLRTTLAIMLLVDEALWHWWNWRIGAWTVQTMLPLHLCSVLVFLSAFMLLNKSYALYEFVYLMGIAGAMQAILTPDAGVYGFPHFRFFQVFVSHGSIVTAGVWMTAVEGYRPHPRSLLRVGGVGLAYMAIVGVINALLGSNYLFIARKPETASLLDVLPAWPWYLPHIILLGFIFLGLLYLPFAVKDYRQRALRRA